MEKIIAFFLSMLTFIGTFTASLVNPTAPEDTGEFEPVVRFLVTSDSHITTMGDIQTTRVEKMIKMGYKIAENDAEYNNLDAVLIAGDVTDQGTKLAFASLKAATDAVLKDGTQFLATVATSHDARAMSVGSLDYYTMLTGQETDFHRVINGFHFIGISASNIAGVHYADYQKEWLVEQLDAAVQDDPEKPIFVIQHEHISNTVYGSSDFEGWGKPDFAEILKKYPQVIDFSGHSHYPINDARSIWQNEFTALGTGGLYYVELTVDEVKTVHPSNHKSIATFWVVEVDAANRIRLRAADLGSQKYLCEYLLDSPFDRSYTPEQQKMRSLAPVFADDTSVKLKSKKVTFSAAESADGMPIFIYRAYAVDAEGNRTPVGKTLAAYYKYNVPDEVTIKFENLPEGDYKIEIVAENCYGMQSEPIVCEF